VKTDEDFIRLTLDIARQARTAGNHPFDAILVGPDGSVLMEAGNAHGDAGDRTGHAERVLMSRASLAYSAEFLA
jgi:tRNA(Arg) A34 adenosine deaminase TadA